MGIHWGSTSRAGWRRLGAGALALALLAGACGGGDDEEGGNDEETNDTGVVAPEDEGAPTPGGDLVYALEAENSGGYCLPEAQLAISGMQVARTIYATLTAPAAEGNIQPFLAESADGNQPFDPWTITVREGVTFHAGPPPAATYVPHHPTHERAR